MNAALTGSRSTRTPTTTIGIEAEKESCLDKTIQGDKTRTVLIPKEVARRSRRGGRAGDPAGSVVRHGSETDGRCVHIGEDPRRQARRQAGAPGGVGAGLEC